MGVPPPPPPILRPPPVPAASAQNQEDRPLSFAEQLQKQKEINQKRQNERINSKVQGLSDDQRVQLQTNLAQTKNTMSRMELELQRRKDLLNKGPAGTKRKGKGDSSDESDAKSDDSDDSAW